MKKQALLAYSRYSLGAYSNNLPCPLPADKAHAILITHAQICEANEYCVTHVYSHVDVGASQDENARVQRCTVKYGEQISLQLTHSVGEEVAKNFTKVFVIRH